MAKYTVVLNSCGENEDEVIGLIASVVGVDSEAVRDKVSSLPCELCTSDNFEKIEELTSAIKSAGGTTNISSNDLVESTEENNNLEESKISSNKNDDPYILGEALIWILGTAILCIFAWILQPLLEWVGWIAPIAFFLFFPTTFGSTKKQEMRIKEREINQANYLSEHNVNKSIDVMYNDQLLNKCIRFIADEINRNIYISQSVKKGYTGAPVSGKMEETGAAV